MTLSVTSVALLDNIGTPETMLIFVIVLMLFGGKKLPEFARGLGKSIREFKKAAAGVEDEFKRALEEDEKQSLAAARNITPPASLPPHSALTPVPAPDPIAIEPPVPGDAAPPSPPPPKPEAPHPMEYPDNPS